MSQKRYRFQDLILHEDDHLILVDKPRDMASLDDKSQNNLHFLAKTYHEDLQLAHRLDKQTSGVLLMAKTPDVYRHLSLQFQKRQIKKTYIAIAGGIQHFQERLIDLPLHVTTNKKVSVNKQQGKRAETIVDTLEAFRHFTLLQCQPVTGRMHQIRVHLAAVNAPIAGDTLYGGTDILLSDLKRKYVPSGRKEERPINHGFLLHAQRLRFTHPATEEAFEQEAPLPKNFETSLKVLRKWDAGQ